MDSVDLVFQFNRKGKKKLHDHSVQSKYFQNEGLMICLIVHGERRVHKSATGLCKNKLCIGGEKKKFRSTGQSLLALQQCSNVS